VGSDAVWEVSMPRPLGLDLRQRVVDSYNNGEGDYAEIAARFGVGVASVSRWLRLDRELSSLEHRPIGGRRKSKIGPQQREAIGVHRHLVAQGYTYKKKASSMKNENRNE
jgi:transposase-like protein